MDRNFNAMQIIVVIVVALRKESVDRNIRIPLEFNLPLVALRKESVDRNLCLVDMFKSSIGSLSARRAWIEISAGQENNENQKVALRKESVDRNNSWAVWVKPNFRRSPQGERG